MIVDIMATRSKRITLILPRAIIITNLDKLLTSINFSLGTPANSAKKSAFPINVPMLLLGNLSRSKLVGDVE